MSGINLPDGTAIRKGAVDAVKKWVIQNGGTVPPDFDRESERISKKAAPLWLWLPGINCTV